MSGESDKRHQSYSLTRIVVYAHPRAAEGVPRLLYLRGENCLRSYRENRKAPCLWRDRANSRTSGVPSERGKEESGEWRGEAEGWKASGGQERNVPVEITRPERAMGEKGIVSLRLPRGTARLKNLTAAVEKKRNRKRN